MYSNMVQKKDKERVMGYYECFDCYLIRLAFPRKPPPRRGRSLG